MSVHNPLLSTSYDFDLQGAGVLNSTVMKGLVFKREVEGK